MKQETSQNCYFLSIANDVCNWLKGCQTCVHDKRIGISQITHGLSCIPEKCLGQGNVMQIGLLSELPQNGR